MKNGQHHKNVSADKMTGHIIIKPHFDKKGTVKDFIITEWNEVFLSFSGLDAGHISGNSLKKIASLHKNNPFDLNQLYEKLKGFTLSAFISDIYVIPEMDLQVILTSNPGQIISVFLISMLSQDKIYFPDDKNKENLHLRSNTEASLIRFKSDGKIIFANEAAQIIIGYAISELDSMQFDDLFSEDDLIMNPIPYQLLEKNNTVFTERKLLKKDGQTILVKMKIFKTDEREYSSYISDMSQHEESDYIFLHNENRFERLLDKSPDIFYSYSTLRGRSYHSNQVKSILGYTPQMLKDDPAFWYNCIHPDDRPMVDVILESTHHGQAIDMEYRILTASGEWKWIHDRSLQMHFLEGEKIIEGIAMDITARKKMEMQLQQTTQTYIELFNTKSDAIYILDKSGKFIDLNKGAEIMDGYRKSELTGSSFKKIAAPELNNLKFIQKNILDVFENNRSVGFEFWSRNKSGRVFLKEIILNKSTYFGEDVILATARDISERRNIEKALKLSEERFRELVNLLPVAVFETNSDFILTFANTRSFEMFGFSKEEFYDNFNCLNILSQSDKENVFKLLEKKLVLEKVNSFEFNALKKDGTEFPISLYFSEIIHEDKPSGYRGIIIDLTEKKKAEHSEHLLKEQLKQIVNLVPSYIFAKDYDGKFLMVNQSLADLFGVSPEDVIGKTDEDYGATPEQVEWYRKHDREVIDSGREVIINEEKVLRKDGTLGWFQTHKIPYQHIGSDHPSILGISLDITERKEAEAQLRESEEKFRSLALLSPFAILIYQGDSIVYSNPAGELITGYSEKELLTMNYWDVVSPEYRDIVRERGRKRLINSSFTNSYEIKINTKEAEVKWVLLNATQIEYQGKRAGLAAFTDITNRKKTEEELRNAKQKAEESDRLKTAFLANMSHEIRTPMNGIIGFLDLLKEINLSTEEKNMFIDVVQESGLRLMNTINDIIEMSKIESKQIEIHPTEINIEKEMKYYYDFFKSETDKKNLELVCKQYLTGSKAIIECDKSKLNGILSNLINNAIKFTSKGKIEFGNMIDDDTVLFFVRDTGAGIPEHRQQAIFERFVHADISMTKPQEGSGLGLSIAKAYVELMGGKIWVVSKAGTGSTFYFTIPYKPVQSFSLVSSETEESVDIDSRQLTVLIAEDDDISYKFIECILSKENVNLIHTVNGEETVIIVRDNPGISLVLMDIRMPVMNGIEATRRIREFNKLIPIIAQTAYALDGDREQLIDAGCNDYLAKPIKRDKLIAMLKKYALTSR